MNGIDIEEFAFEDFQKVHESAAKARELAGYGCIIARLSAADMEQSMEQSMHLEE